MATSKNNKGKLTPYERKRLFSLWRTAQAQLSSKPEALFAPSQRHIEAVSWLREIVKSRQRSHARKAQALLSLITPILAERSQRDGQVCGLGGCELGDLLFQVRGRVNGRTYAFLVCPSCIAKSGNLNDDFFSVSCDSCERRYYVSDDGSRYCCDACAAGRSRPRPIPATLREIYQTCEAKRNKTKTLTSAVSR